MGLALTVGALTAGSIYLMLQRDYLRVILGFVILSHAANLLLFSAGGIARRGEPLGESPDPAITADPLPQAFVLTAIVIAFAITIYMLVLSVTGTRRDADSQADSIGEDDDEWGAATPGDPDAEATPGEDAGATSGGGER